MSIALLVILGPLTAAGMILAVRRSVTMFALLGVGVSLIAAVASLVRVEDGERFATSFPGLPEYPFRLVVDPLSAVLATVVAAVATLIFVYAVGYMRAEADQVRFFAGMSFFVAAMQTLVLAGDWVLFIFGWELIALASYLLIGFWFDRPGVASAATRAFLTTPPLTSGCISAPSFSSIELERPRSRPRWISMGGPRAPRGCFSCSARLESPRRLPSMVGSRTRWSDRRRCRASCTRDRCPALATGSSPIRAGDHRWPDR